MHCTTAPPKSQNLRKPHLPTNGEPTPTKASKSRVAKPRVKSAKKAPLESQTPELVMKEVCGLMTRVEAMLSAGDEGDLGGRLMRIAETYLIPHFYEVLKPDAFSADSVHKAIQALFDVQAAISGAEAIHHGDSRGALMEQAFDCIDAVSGLLDNLGFWPDEPQVSQRHIEKEREQFANGCDLAVDLLGDATKHHGTDGSSERRWHREGRPQERFVKRHLQRLIDDPSMLDGFDAVMSSLLAHHVDGEESTYSKLPVAEFEAGEVGADGTQTLEAANAKDAAPESGISTTSPPSTADSKLTTAIEHIFQALAIVDVCAERLDDGLAGASGRLLGLAAEKVEKAIESKSNDDIESASLDTCHALETLQALVDRSSDDAIWGAVTLTEIAKQNIDAAWSAP
jgi:hypothetical protein